MKALEVELLNAAGLVCADRLFPEAHTGFRQSQASLIWRELEEEEEGLNGGSARLLHSALWRRQVHQNSEEEDKDMAGVSLQQPHGRRRMISDYPADDCGHFFVLGTLAAVFALFINVLYPFLSKLELRGF